MFLLDICLVLGPIKSPSFVQYNCFWSLVILCVTSCLEIWASRFFKFCKKLLFDGLKKCYRRILKKTSSPREGFSPPNPHFGPPTTVIATNGLASDRSYVHSVDISKSVHSIFLLFLAQSCNESVVFAFKKILIRRL